jgi:hypothetical protein
MKIKQSVSARLEQLEQSAAVADIAYERKQRELWAAEAVMDAEEDAEQEFMRQALALNPSEREEFIARFRGIVAQERRAAFALVR